MMIFASRLLDFTDLIVGDQRILAQYCALHPSNKSSLVSGGGLRGRSGARVVKLSHRERYMKRNTISSLVILMKRMRALGANVDYRADDAYSTKS